VLEQRGQLLHSRACFSFRGRSGLPGLLVYANLLPGKFPDQILFDGLLRLCNERT
jgi:hypothetical protein